MAFNIEGKVALVTGANRGIGKAITETLLANGASKVYAAVRDPKSASPLVDAYGDRVVVLEMDLAKSETIIDAADKATDVQLVVNNAGVLTTTDPLSAETEGSLRFEMDVNVFGLIRVAQAFAPVLKANGGGAFAQLNSVASLKAFAPFSTYCASKAAAYSVTQSLRWSLAEQGTEVYSVHPGPIATDMGRDAGFEDVAEPASQVGEALVNAMRKGEFHVWTDTMAREIGGAYEGFGTGVVEADFSESLA